MCKKDKIKRYLIITRIKRACSARIISLIVTSLVGWMVTGNAIIGVKYDLETIGKNMIMAVLSGTAVYVV